jgi:pantoate--beta-alanine ligase
MYPSGFTTHVEVEGLSAKLEGAARPGHFRGVATVVMKLLQIIRPNFAYFGRKDAQQAQVISQVTRDLNLDTEIVICPIVREEDGLALSSRNAYLNAEERKAATVLYFALKAVKDQIAVGVRDSLQLQSAMNKVLSAEPRARVEYAAIVDAETFEPVTRVGRAAYALITAYLGKTRLLDNMLITPVGANSEEFVVEL